MQSGWDMGRTGCGQDRTHCPPCLHPAQGRTVMGHTGPGQWWGMAGSPGWCQWCWQCQCGSVPAQSSYPQLQERYPDHPMELRLSARRQPRLSCRPDALHGALFSSAEAFVVLPNATRVPAFLLNIVSVW